jgi:hypothetical protein
MSHDTLTNKIVSDETESGMKKNRGTSQIVIFS